MNFHRWTAVRGACQIERRHFRDNSRTGLESTRRFFFFLLIFLLKIKRSSSLFLARFCSRSLSLSLSPLMLPLSVNFDREQRPIFALARGILSNFYEFSFEAIFFLIRRRWSMARRLNGFCAFYLARDVVDNVLPWSSLTGFIFPSPRCPFCSARSCGSLNFRRRPRKNTNRGIFMDWAGIDFDRTFSIINDAARVDTTW